MPLSQRDRKFAAALVKSIADAYSDGRWENSTQQLMDFVDAMAMDYDGDDVDMVIAAAKIADERANEY